MEVHKEGVVVVLVQSEKNVLKKIKRHGVFDTGNSLACFVQ